MPSTGNGPILPTRPTYTLRVAQTAVELSDRAGANRARRLPALGLEPYRSGPGVVLFHNMVHCIAQAGGAVKGVLWYQGESDGEPGLAESYATLFSSGGASLASSPPPAQSACVDRAVEPLFPHPTLLPASDEERERAWSLVREAQRQLARQMTQVAVVPTFDLPLSDLIHTSPAGNLLLGERLARAALGLGGNTKLIRIIVPLICKVRGLIDQGTLVELSFAAVTDRLGQPGSPAANCFKVEDSTGDVPITEVIYPMNHTIQLRLARPLAAKRGGAWRLWLQSRYGAGGHGSSAAHVGVLSGAD